MYRTVAQLDNLGALLASTFPQWVTRTQLPEPSVQGRPVYALRLRAGAEGPRRGVLLVGGTHARELMNPDLLIELAVDLLVSYRDGTDIVLGERTWPAEDVAVMLESLDVLVLPCANPDGREYVLTVDDLWRKNRRDNPGTACDGVDLNRNADFLWGVTEGQTSCAPCSDVYAGPDALSEPENRNVRHLLDTAAVDCFADVHSYSELVLYPWGHAATQVTDPAQRFTALPAGTCAPIGRPHQEYMTPRDLQRFQTVAGTVVDAIAAVRGRAYSPQPGVTLYPTTGTLSDYAYSRHVVDPEAGKVYAFTFETGPWMGSVRDSFHPPDPDPIKREAESGLLALLQQCVCAIEVIGARLRGREDEVAALRDLRDRVLATTAPGRAWIALYERVQGPLLTEVLADPGLRTQAAELLGRAGDLLRDPDATLGAETARSAMGLLVTLAERTGRLERQRQADLRAVRSMLEQTVGGSAEGIARLLTEQGPDRRPGADQEPRP